MSEVYSFVRFITEGLEGKICREERYKVVIKKLSIKSSGLSSGNRLR